MQTIMERMNNPLTGFLTLLTGSTVSLTEILRGGSLMLTISGGALAALGGIWTYRTARVRFQIEIMHLKITELEFEKANGLHHNNDKKKTL